MTTRRTIGVQSSVFRDRPLDDALAELDRAGIGGIELGGWHAAPDDEAATAAAERAVEDAGVTVLGYGVVDVADPDEARRYAAFADRLGADYLIVNYPPARDDVTDALIAAAEEFDLSVAIHNYSSVHHDDLSTVFSTIDDARGVLERYDHPRLGLCLDTGHFLVEGGDPAAVVREFGDRIVAVHLKDTSDEEIEDLPGAGRLDLPGVVGLLADRTHPDVPLVIEYELPPERATDALAEAAANVRAAVERVESVAD